MFILTFSLLLSLFIFFVLVFLFQAQAQALLIWLSLSVSSPSLAFLKRICAVGQGYSGRYKQPKQYHLSSYLLSNPGISCPGEYEKPKQKLQRICWISKQKHTENIVSLLITAKHTLLKILFCYNFSAMNFLLKMLFITIVAPLFIIQFLHLFDL